MKDNKIIMQFLKNNNDLLTEENDFLKKEIDTYILEVINYQKRIDRLTKKNEELLSNNTEINKIIEKNLAKDILLYLDNCKSIKKTAEYFGYEPTKLFSDIQDWNICHDNLHLLDDYREYLYKPH